jgi:N-acetylglutamate synthase-like GNAT family acetyltransferase
MEVNTRALQPGGFKCREACIICGKTDWENPDGEPWGPRTIIICQCCSDLTIHVECYHSTYPEKPPLTQTLVNSPNWSFFCSPQCTKIASTIVSLTGKRQTINSTQHSLQLVKYSPSTNRSSLQDITTAIKILHDAFDHGDDLHNGKDIIEMVCKSYEDPLPVTTNNNDKKKKKKPEDKEKKTEEEKEEEGKRDLETVSTAPTNDNDTNNNNKENGSNKEKEEEDGNPKSKDDRDSDTVMTLTIKEEGEKEEEELQLVDFSGFKVVLLRKGPTIVSAATIRIFGSSFAEMPYLATAAGYRREGHARLLITSLDSMLKQLGVQWLVVPALEEAQEFWMDRFGFESFYQGEDAIDVMERCLMPENSHLLRRLVGAPFPTSIGGGGGGGGASQKNKGKGKGKDNTAINNGGGLKSKKQQQTKQQQQQQSQQGGKRVRFAAGAYQESDHEDCDGTIISNLAVTPANKKHQNVDSSKTNKLNDDDVDGEVKGGGSDDGGEGVIAGCGKCGAKDSPDWHLDEDDEDIILCTGCYNAAKKAGKQPIVGKMVTPKQKSSGGGGKGKGTPSISENKKKKKKKGKGKRDNGHGKNKNKKKKKGKKSSKGKAPLSLSLSPPSSSSHTVSSTTVFQKLQRSSRKVRFSLLSGLSMLHHTDEACSAVINADSVMAGLSDRLAASVCELKVVESQLQEKEVENTQLKEQLESAHLKMKEMEMKLSTAVGMVAMQDMVVKTDNNHNHNHNHNHHDNNALVGEGKGGEGVIVVEEKEKSSSEGSVMETDQQQGGKSSRKQSHNNNASSENDEDVVAAFNRLFGDDKNTDMKE